jgi:phenylacetate-CoA ligase
MSGWIGAYHRLPKPLRAAAASARGYQLRWWRYGPETEKLAAEALERESWSPERWRTWQADRLARLLARAAARVPYYRAYWEASRKAGDPRSPERLEDWPILSKETLRAQPRAFLADDCRPGRMFHEHTSGTTGKPLDVWWSRATVRAWYALFEARVRRWNGVSRNDRWGMLGGQLVTPARQTSPPFWIWNGGLRQLYLSSYHLAPATVGAYLDAIRRSRVRYLFGYASSLYSLARLAHEQRLLAPQMVVAISNAEPLLAHQREVIREVFGCPARDTYGMSEIVVGASECEAGLLHSWPEVGVTEILSDVSGTGLAPGEVGRIVSTGLFNADMPLVRYDTGDRGALAEAREACSCGRTLPLIRSLDGRFDDVVITPDGRRVGRLDPVFKASLAIREAQIIQETLHRVRVKVVAAEGFGDADLKTISLGLRERLGDGMEVVFERVDQIPRTAAGKFRAVISHVRPAATPESTRPA